jgi:hypothetical protein
MPARRKEEDRPSPGYLQVLKDLGPREGESNSAFRQRLHRVDSSRKYWMGLWKTHSGNGSAACREAGIDRSNLSQTLRNVGLSRSVLDNLVKEPVRSSSPLPVPTLAKAILDPIHFPHPKKK